MTVINDTRAAWPKVSERPEFAENRAKPAHLPSLTGVRGLAAMWVFLTHVYPFAAQVLHAPWIMNCSFFFNGFRGVDLFFVLSGFILMHVHARDFVMIRAQELKDFFITRFFRVYPLNTVVLLALVPLVLLSPSYVAMARSYSDAHFAYRAHNLSFAGFIQTLLLVQTWTVLKLGEWNIVSWTLSAEVLGYILFPILARAISQQQSWRRCVGIAFISLALLTGLLCLFGHANNNPTGTFGAIRMLGCFTSGVALYRCYQLLPALQGQTASWITIIALVFIGLTLLFPAVPVLDSFAFAALVFGLAYRRGRVNALLESRIAMFLGKISFSFYLTHYLIITITAWAIGRWLVGQDRVIEFTSVFGLAALCLCVAALLYHYVERPSQRLGRHFVRAR